MIRSIFSGSFVTGKAYSWVVLSQSCVARNVPNLGIYRPIISVLGPYFMGEELHIMYNHFHFRTFICDNSVEFRSLTSEKAQEKNTSKT